MVFFTVAY